MRVIQIYTVKGVTDRLSVLARHFNVGYQTAHKRLKLGWTREQALGVEPPPPPRPRWPRRASRPRTGRTDMGHVWNRQQDPLPRLPRLADAATNFMAALYGLPAEEFLRREGVGLNEHPLNPID